MKGEEDQRSEEWGKSGRNNEVVAGGKRENMLELGTS